MSDKAAPLSDFSLAQRAIAAAEDAVQLLEDFTSELQLRLPDEVSDTFQDVLRRERVGETSGQIKAVLAEVDVELSSRLRHGR